MAENFTEKKRVRYKFIDVLRGISVIWMIETHVVDICLDKSWKTGFFYEMLNISNGFVAVTFLFCAGAGFWIAASRKIDDYKSFKSPLWVYLRRLLFILGMAYSLNLPIFSFNKMLSATPEQITFWLGIDVLHTIVYTSLIALLIAMISPRIHYIKYISAILAIGIFSMTQWTYMIDPFQTVPYPFAFFIGHYPISKFPLIPWSGYFFAGLAITSFFMDSNNKEKLAKWMLGISFFLPFIIFAIKNSGLDPTPINYNWWYVSPLHMLYRVCGPTLAFSLLFLTEKYYNNWKFTPFLQTAGQESLFLYVSHIMIVYGTIANFGLRYMGANTFNPLETILVYIAITAVCYYFAWAWHYLKANQPSKSRLIMVSSIVLFFLIFFFKQY